MQSFLNIFATVLEPELRSTWFFNKK